MQYSLDSLLHKWLVKRALLLFLLLECTREILSRSGGHSDLKKSATAARMSAKCQDVRCVLFMLDPSVLV